MSEISEIPAAVMDEIALEGLDGITIEGLFTRLKERPGFASSFIDDYKLYIWDTITQMGDIDMFVLPEPRKALVIFNRYDYVDPELGMVLEPDIVPDEIYPHAPVDDKIKNVRGSCAHYADRVCVYDMASQMSLQDVLDRWRMRLVLVASQKMRTLALMGPSVDPELELNIIQYCILERVGRSRHLGEVTQGRVSLQTTGEDPKALFYHRKFLMKNGLIVKQIHHQKSGTQNCSGSLLHLPRFYVERWPKVLFLTKRVIDILRSCKDYIADYEEIRKKLGLTNSLKKLFQNSYFQRFVRTDLRLPYRHLYPDAKENEWRSMNSLKEKMIRVIQLLDPSADVETLSTRDDEFEIDDEEHNDGNCSREEFNRTLNRAFLSQAYQCFEGAGVNGYSQMELVEKMGLPKLNARTVSRNLLKKGVVSTFMNDVGRQRVSRFRARKWDQQCTRMQTIQRDIQHMRAELLNKALGAGHEIPSPVPANVLVDSPGSQKSKKRPADVSIDDLKIEMHVKRGHKRSCDSSISGPPFKIKRNTAFENEEFLNSTGQDMEEIRTSACSTSAYAPAPLYCSVEKFQSKEAMRKYFQHQSKDGPVMTYRIFKRINMILEYVKIHKVVDDHSKFLKLINEEEEREGLNMKIDKKSLLRLLIRLKEDGLLKLHSYFLTDGVKVKPMMFICERDVPLDHPAVVSAIEQAKMKLFIVNRESINLSVAGTTARCPQNQKSVPSKKQKLTFVYDKKVGRKYGFCPKFIRMRTLHQFLFYLVYGYEGDENLDQDAVIPFLEAKDVFVDKDLCSELTQVYVLDVNWKMFIPPLPAYSGLPRGWSIMCDLLLRMPLSLFVRVFNVCYVVAGLHEYLQHPIRRHFLVRQLPVPMQNGLMAFRKYIFSIHEVLQRLCYIGLVQFGPQRLKEKDQVLVYVNRRASLLDTVTSKPGYHQVSEEDYPEMKYEFKSMQDVDTYWYNLWNICLNTQLGGRMCVQGKDIVLEHLSAKQQMLHALQPVRPSRAPGRDTGAVPGDRRGAAGLDSAIFAHLKRNWNWANISTKTQDIPPKKVDRRKCRLMNVKAAPVIFTKCAIILKRSINFLHNGRFSGTRAERRPHIIPAGAEILPKKGQKSKHNVVRRIEVRKTRVSNKPYYDDVDLKALQLMSKLRVDWSTEEDTLLLLCKVASMYLCPNPRQQTIAFSAIRDILHRCIPEAQNKTSRACQRRILYMMKNLATSNNLAMNLEELKQDEDVCERFGRPEDNARGSNEKVEEFETRIHDKFHALVNELQGRSDRMVTAPGTFCRTIPDTAGDFWELFDVVEPRTVIKKKGNFQDVKNVVDIHCSVVNTIIHSSLCSATDKTSWAYQLFRVYQQYPDSLLRAAMAKLRQDQMVSLKKSYARYKHKGNYLPLSSSPYQLSVSYLQLIQTKYQYGVFQEAYAMLKDLVVWREGTNGEQGKPVTAASGGTAATMVELLCKRNISLSVEIPEQVIILDPWISEKDETYTRIVQRYKDILQTYRTGRDSTTSALFRLSHTDTKEANDYMEMPLPDIGNFSGCIKDMEARKSKGALMEHYVCNDYDSIIHKASSVGKANELNVKGKSANAKEQVEVHEKISVSEESHHSINETLSELVLTESDTESPEEISRDDVLQVKLINDKKLVQETTENTAESSDLLNENIPHSLLENQETAGLSKPSDLSKDAISYESYRKQNLEDTVNSGDISMPPDSWPRDKLAPRVLNSAMSSVTETQPSRETKNTVLVTTLMECDNSQSYHLISEVEPAKEISNTVQDANAQVTPIECEGPQTVLEQMLETNEENIKQNILESKVYHKKEENLLQCGTLIVPSAPKNSEPTHVPSTQALNEADEPINIEHVQKNSGSLKQDFSQVPRPKEDENIQNIKNVEVDSRCCGRMERALQRKWGRLDFEWTPDKEWEIESDLCERSVEESDENEVPDDERIRGDYIDIVSESEDGDGTTANNQQTLVARAASRIALFMMREEMDDSSPVKSNQHAHDFFVVNSCSVFCSVGTEKSVSTSATTVTTSPKSSDITREKLFSLSQEKIDDVLALIRNAAIVDISLNKEKEVFKIALEDCHSFIRALLHFIECQKHIGATLQQIQAFYQNQEAHTLDLAAILSLLVQKQVLMRTGVTVPRYVHQRHVWPWLAHTFKFLRLEREKVTPIESRIVACSEERACGITEEEGVAENGAPERSIAEKEVISVMETEENTSVQSNANSSAPAQEMKDSVLDLEMAEGLYMASDTGADNETRHTVEVVEISGNSKQEETGFVQQDGLVRKQDDCEILGDTENDASRLSKRCQGRKTKQLPITNPFGNIVGTKEMRKAAQNLAFNERDEIHIAIRPWVRINGTINRRVLDRLLGAVLGHAMHQPGQSLHSFGRRFQPALQPVHTRELIEILHQLGCVKLLVWQQKQKVTLFSKPQSVVFVAASGIENEEEIVVEPEADAVCRLGQFIGDKSYNQDFMAAQEQMFCSRSPSEDSGKKKSRDSPNGSNSSLDPNTEQELQ